MNDELASMHAFLRKIGRAGAAGATHDEQTKDQCFKSPEIQFSGTLSDSL